MPSQQQQPAKNPLLDYKNAMAINNNNHEPEPEVAAALQPPPTHHRRGIAISLSLTHSLKYLYSCNFFFYTIYRVLCFLNITYKSSFFLYMVTYESLS